MTSSASPQPSLLYQLPSIVEPLTIAALFGRDQPLEIELGSGDGSFLVSYAQQHPGRNFIGVERLLGRIRKMERKARRAGLTNLKGIRIESLYLLQYLLPRHSAEALHIYFPDPWPKRRHRYHRLVNEAFPEVAAQVLTNCGRVYLRTDDSDYFQQMLQVFSGSTRFLEVETPASLLAVKTDFEQDFVARGVPARYVAYERRSDLQTSMTGPLSSGGF